MAPCVEVPDSRWELDFMSLAISPACPRIAVLLAASVLYAPNALAEDPAAALRERYTALTQTLEQSPIQPGLHVCTAWRCLRAHSLSIRDGRRGVRAAAELV
jgi:hypothetical protein